MLGRPQRQIQLIDVHKGSVIVMSGMRSYHLLEKKSINNFDFPAKTLKSQYMVIPSRLGSNRFGRQSRLGGQLQRKRSLDAYAMAGEKPDAANHQPAKFLSLSAKPWRICKDGFSISLFKCLYFSTNLQSALASSQRAFIILIANSCSFFNSFSFSSPSCSSHFSTGRK